MALAKLS